MNIELATKKHYESCKERHFSHPVVQAFAQPKLDWIYSKVDLQGLKVLEVGGGNGYFSNLLMRTSDLTVVDISKHQLNYNPAKKKVVASVYELPFEDNSFDVVFSSNLLHHLNDPKMALEEMKRVSRNIIIIVEPNRNNPILFIGALLLKHERGAIKYSRKFTSSLIKDSGLSIQHHTYIGSLVMPNATPTFLLPVLKYGKSLSPASFFQIFICKK